MAGLSVRLLGGAVGMMLLGFAGAAQAEVVDLVGGGSKDVAEQSAVLAMPFPPSVMLFIGGVAGLMLLVRRRKRKTPALH